MRLYNQHGVESSASVENNLSIKGKLHDPERMIDSYEVWSNATDIISLGKGIKKKIITGSG